MTIPECMKFTQEYVQRHKMSKKKKIWPHKTQNEPVLWVDPIPGAVLFCLTFNDPVLVSVGVFSLPWLVSELQKLDVPHISLEIEVHFHFRETNIRKGSWVLQVDLKPLYNRWLLLITTIFVFQSCTGVKWSKREVKTFHLQR